MCPTPMARLVTVQTPCPSYAATDVSPAMVPPQVTGSALAHRSLTAGYGGAAAHGASKPLRHRVCLSAPLPAVDQCQQTGHRIRIDVRLNHGGVCHKEMDCSAW